MRGVAGALRKFLADPDQWGQSLAGAGAVHRLEQQFSRLVGRPYALAVPNATLGLWAVFEALDIRGADVLVPGYSWGGTIAGLISHRNRPVFADIKNETLCLDPERVAWRITPETKAILAVDAYGVPCDGEALRKVAQNYGVPLIQDCAQSFGAYVGKHHTGYWADAAVFSLGWKKALSCGEGGLIVTGDRRLYERLVWTTQHPIRQRRDVPHLPSNEMAMNLRINPLSAVWASTMFEKALERVGRIRVRSIETLELLSRLRLSRTPVPDLTRVRPSFSALTFDPTRAREEIGRCFRENNLALELSAPPITTPLYESEAYLRLLRENNWKAQRRCLGVDRHCRTRLQVTRLSMDQRSSAGVQVPGGDA